ncbi:LuxR family transcriptional regulator [Rugosimonospora africana]|uniref:LuxR family transcriptional regulator n=1 Tax=Rugosimonospora africana TaxID=556532 RepID=UPI001EF33EC7|nr:LuxR family transcriptional regulator [Rugosimonospora africana]
MVDVPLIGRARDLTVLREALDEVERRDSAAVFLLGDSGVGKTRLLAAATDQLRATGAVVLSGACLDIGDASPLHPLRQALRRHAAEPVRADTGRAEPGGADTGGAETSVAAAVAASAAVHELMEILDGTAISPDGAGALLERVSRGLAAVAGGRVLVLAVDDLQWADRSTRQLLLYLLAGLGGVRLLVLGAVRTETVLGTDPLRQMLSELRRLRSVRVLELSPLDRAETEALATAVAGRPLDPVALELVWVRSGGNPFFVEELARGARDGRVELSDTLREMVFARVGALPEPARRVVTAVAAAVEPVEHELLARVVNLPEDPLIGAARTAVDKRILVAGEDGYRFRHRLIKEVLEPGLLPGERAGWHRRYAEALSDLPGGQMRNARLAHHWRMAGERIRALRAAVAAAEEAERLHGFAEAFDHWADALELADGLNTTDRAEITVASLYQRAAEAAHRCGEHEQALALLGRPEASGSGISPSRLHIRVARYLAALGRPTEAEVEYERVLAGDQRTAQDTAIAAAHSAELLLQLGRYAEAGRRAARALEVARSIDDPASSLVLAGAVLGFSQAYLDDPAAGLATVREALATAERLGGPVDIARAYLHLAELLTGPLNELEDGVEVARRGADYVERLGLGRTYGSRLLAVASNGLFRLGEWSEAENIITTALRHRPAGAEAVELLLARCRIRVGRGDLDAAERDLEATDTLLAAGGGARHVLPLLTLRAGLMMWRGRPDQAREAVRQGLDLAESRSDDVWLQAPLVWHGLRAEAEARSTGAAAPDPDAIRRLRLVAERISSDSAPAAKPVRETVIGYRELCAAEISRVEGRSEPAAWERAAAVWERNNHPYPAAYARLRQAEALFGQRTRNAEAARVLRDAYRTAVRLGAGPFIEEIRQLADRARTSLDEPAVSPTQRPPTQQPPNTQATETRPPSPEHAGTQPAGTQPSRTQPAGTGELAGLTERELQVLARVAAGDTNREIGEQLYISPRTVGVHISHILDKLGIRSRVQATAIYERSRRGH